MTAAELIRRIEEKAKISSIYLVPGKRAMRGRSRRRTFVYPLIMGIAVGMVLSIPVLASPHPQGYQWPDRNQVEFATAGFGPWTVDASGVASLPSNCTTMLVDMDSTFPAEVWVVPHNATINYNSSEGSPSYYYWSGPTPTEHISAIVSISNPAAGVWLAVRDPSSNQTGQASWGFVFSASDCP